MKLNLKLLIGILTAIVLCGCVRLNYSTTEFIPKIGYSGSVSNFVAEIAQSTNVLSNTNLFAIRHSEFTLFRFATRTGIGSLEVVSTNNTKTVTLKDYSSEAQEEVITAMGDAVGKAVGEAFNSATGNPL